MTWQPTAPLENLKRRAELLRVLRRFFDDRGFLEVQTPILSADTLIDRYVEPLTVEDETLPITPHGTRIRYLQTSPEFAMKRLLAAGMESIYQIGPVFRRGDRGLRHNVEFTMLEWYRTGEDYHAAMNFLADLVRTCLQRAGDEGGRKSHSAPQSPDHPLTFQTYAETFQKHLDIDPHRATSRVLRNLVDSLKIPYPDSYSDAEDTDLWLDLLFADRVQPNLDAVIVYDYPGTQSQLARSRTLNDDVVVSERFELFLNGIEIANGYHELLDADELRIRFENTIRLRAADGSRSLPLDSRLLQAMQSSLPPCSGTALGIDRLLMAIIGTDSIDDVLTFPIENA